VVAVEPEAVLAGPMRASLDLGDHRGLPCDLRVADDARAELAADDAQVAQLLAARELAGRVEEREARGRSAAARGAVDLAVRENGHVALDVRALALPEDDAVDVAKIRLAWMHEVVRGLEVGLQFAAALDQP